MTGQFHSFLACTFPVFVSFFDLCLFLHWYETDIRLVPHVPLARILFHPFPPQCSDPQFIFSFDGTKWTTGLIFITDTSLLYAL